MTAFLTGLYLVLLAACTIPLTWAPIQYALRSPWRETETGRTFMAVLASLAVAVDLSAVFTLLAVAEGPAPLALALLAMAFLNVTGWRVLRTIRRAQGLPSEGEPTEPDTHSAEQENRHP